jgi:hypothetical protein
MDLREEAATSGVPKKMIFFFSVSDSSLEVVENRRKELGMSCDRKSVVVIAGYCQDRDRILRKTVVGENDLTWQAMTPNIKRKVSRLWSNLAMR